MADPAPHKDNHNGANGERTGAGCDENRSWNCGVEGPTDDPEVLALRARQQRNFLATLLLSQGIPMLVAGDEMGRTQGGNNNAYGQDNETSWIDWRLKDRNAGLLDFTRRLLELRNRHPVLRRRRWFQGGPIRGSRAPDIAWFTPEGEARSDEPSMPSAQSISAFVNRASIP